MSQGKSEERSLTLEPGLRGQGRHSQGVAEWCRRHVPSTVFTGLQLTRLRLVVADGERRVRTKSLVFHNYWISEEPRFTVHGIVEQRKL